MCRLHVCSSVCLFLCLSTHVCYCTVCSPSNITAPTTSSQFIRCIFDKYGENGTMSLESFERLLLNLGLQGSVATAHRVESDEHPDHQHPDHDTHSSEVDQAFTGTNRLHANSHSIDHHFDDMLLEHAALLPEENDSNHVSLAPSPLTASKQCLSAEKMLGLVERETSLTQTDFLHICPVLVYQLDLHNCHRSEHHAHLLLPALKVWGYAVLAVLVISLVGLLAVAIVPLMQKVFYNYLIQFLVALAIGSLTGDALLHLLPHSLVGHDESHTQQHNSDAIYKGLLAFAGLYLFFLTERVMQIVTAWRRRCKTPMAPTKSDTDEKAERSHPGCEEHMLMVQHSHREVKIEDGHTHDVPDSIASVAWMVIMGDGLHNFTDGLAIGAAFADSLTGGLSTSLAVFCHELPHELGDFAMLLSAGMKVRQALFYNCVSSLLCLLGMVVGVMAGNLHHFHLYIFSLAAGIFLYIALVDMLPELKKGSGCHLLLQNLGLLIGAGIMLLIALYEHDTMVP